MVAVDFGFGIPDSALDTTAVSNLGVTVSALEHQIVQHLEAMLQEIAQLTDGTTNAVTGHLQSQVFNLSDKTSKLTDKIETHLMGQAGNMLTAGMQLGIPVVHPDDLPPLGSPPPDSQHRPPPPSVPPGCKPVWVINRWEIDCPGTALSPPSSTPPTQPKIQPPPAPPTTPLDAKPWGVFINCDTRQIMFIDENETGGLTQAPPAGFVNYAVIDTNESQLNWYANNWGYWWFWLYCEGYQP